MLDWMNWLSHVGLSILLGMMAEWIAANGSLWVYRSRVWIVCNVLGMFGIAMGSVSASPLDMTEQIILAGGMGLAYEWVNTSMLKGWHFPAQRWVCLPGPYSIGTLLALAWAMVPPIVSQGLVCWQRLVT